jgi:hypothetical protein
MSGDVTNIFIGISRPNVDQTLISCVDGWFMHASDGGLYGNDKHYDNEAAGSSMQGNRVGVLLGLDGAPLHFFTNGTQHGSGHGAGGVRGPVVAAVQICHKTHSARLMPNPQQPQLTQQAICNCSSRT